MAKPVTRYVCQSCGTPHPKWQGKCEGCGEWNTLVEETVEARSPGPAGRTAGGRRVEFVGLKGRSAPPARTAVGIAELDRVLGGGFVPGSVVLVGGDPGIGKSTLLLQAAARVARGKRTLYISGEEAVEQVRLRALRLGVAEAPMGLAAAGNLRDIVASLEDEHDIGLVVIDSIQTVWLDSLDSAPGTVSQVRACAAELSRLAKTRGFALVLVGHVTKEGTLAGPRVLEHMVDATLYFEGDRGHQFRILRAVKNRFGATDEIGVFEMTEAGLMEVPNPSALFLAERRGNVSGSAVFAGLEGTRPVLVEVQALLSPSNGGSPRRQVVGWDSGRLSMLLAVLESRCGLSVGQNDVYLNIAGGLRITEPAADLAVAAALASAATDQPSSPGMVYFGEVGLSGEIRQVAQMETRLREAHKLGFDAATLPRRVARGGRALSAPEGLRLVENGHLVDLVAEFAAGARPRARKAPPEAE
ncbi:DNA repair protein RadA [Roseomonas mucosa]|uniref:DNA repair protein RadA n=1 Tax=Roseomonas mucosa TaxID=207340 RepID=A0A4Y1N2K8_9PROT|nr:DNA repair protein RadA [Roseomonas mucosa]AWV23973.1 DNA repair protein RadA [Roseomonas mucosa]MDT8277124.1 DNA repair protein RadA [Roseomonas mucosa]MDT8354491.1 DNA repair protein RadA [Roseomonas mucosa]MDU7521160.1 DNA repair protein RadA [Roseomonas mucosa]